ncbi:hypothetical protein Pmar_PMAR021400 [Perkinsus marinus ATCC 50983]|uniref:Uncharacterized protein n=1 Tax=Perkinsus marinus (strain ATCC 50983 / TXsc) TaxID=423536 RepID=C5KX64_PERM5|nr:hypothetical protein Pmar_PMAR021400 [Perkinsus marinus ATCC 50983]EER10920.1 hypothetical protein Pmar_PMAR021400 [Perkinsus marinus ATCC 50983]|eukprot:XP_002779125.1 hypothetical protein Pmar_PMAR021400 [Perkinsus marinus ATCC 50983]
MARRGQPLTASNQLPLPPQVFYHKGADIRVPIRSSHEECNPVVMLRVEVERWTLVQFYATSLEGPEESQFDENYLIEFNVIGEFDKINYLSVPGKGITAPIEVITSEISMNHPDEKVKTIARLIKKERR